MKLVKSKKVWTILLAGAAVISFLVWLAYFVIPHTIFSGLTNYYMPNYAKEAIEPIDRALVKAGAVRICEDPVSGREPGSMQPSYTANYQFNVSADETLQVLQRIAKENGYSPTLLPGDDEQVPSYQDDSGKASPYPDLETGNISFGFSLYSDTAV